MALHDALQDRFQPGDRVVYLGNYIGYGDRPCETIDELLTFRRLLLSMPGIIPDDIIYLRGGQEEMWQKLLQIHFAPNPVELLLWIQEKGLSATLEPYGISFHDGIVAAQEGVMALTHWTNSLREAIRLRPGHEIFGMQLKRAAYLPESSSSQMLFVHAGINPDLPLDEQGDSFWWGNGDFNRISTPYAPFHKVIRGFDPEHRGIYINGVTACIDGGCGFGGSLVCAGFNRNAEMFELLEA